MYIMERAPLSVPPNSSPPRSTWMQDDYDGEDSFHLSDSYHKQSLKKVFSSSRYASVSATLSHPANHAASKSHSTSMRPLTGEHREEEEEAQYPSKHPDKPSEDNSSTNCGCGWCLRFPRQFMAAQRHRKCPHTFQICLVFFMFVLLGIAERGSFVVLFHLLDHHFPLDPGKAVTIYFFVRFLIYIMYPVMGCLADTFFGHYKVIRACLCVAWLGTAFMALSFAIHEAFASNCKTLEHDCAYLPSWIFITIGYIILGAGLTGIRVNLIPFGADQLPDASGGELSSYFYWHYFGITLGHFIAVIALNFMFNHTYFSFVFLTIVIAISLFLCIFVLFQWTIVPKNGNPLKLVSNVVRASFDTKRPMKRTAFDVGMPNPTRLDRAKIKYGGPYTMEEVEDVKTFFRILLIVMSCMGYYTVFSQLQSTAAIQTYKMTFEWFYKPCSGKQTAHLAEFNHGGVNFTCKQSQALAATVFGAANLLPLLLFIPFFDRLIYACLTGWKWFSMLARMAVGNFFIVACVLCATVVEGMRITWLASAIRNNETVLINTIDYHEDISSYNVASPMPALYIAIPMFCFVFAELLCNITAVEFIYAQAPGSMKGLLIGMLFASEGIAMGLSAIITFILSFSPNYQFFAFFANTPDFYKEVLNGTSSCLQDIIHSSSFSCTDGILFVYITLVVLAVLSAIFFGVAATRYKFRKRDQDPYMPIWLIPEDQETRIQKIVRKCCC